MIGQDAPGFVRAAPLRLSAAGGHAEQSRGFRSRPALDTHVVSEHPPAMSLPLNFYKSAMAGSFAARGVEQPSGVRAVAPTYTQQVTAQFMAPAKKEFSATAFLKDLAIVSANGARARRYRSRRGLGRDPSSRTRRARGARARRGVANRVPPEPREGFFFARQAHHHVMFSSAPRSARGR